MISIDDWLLPGADYGKPLLLAAGEHRIRLVPDFSNISPQKLFMNYFWPEKHVIFFLAKEQNMVVAARLIDLHKLEWKVEMYLIEMLMEEMTDMDRTSDRTRQSVNE